MGLTTVSCCSEGPGCINMSKTMLLRYLQEACDRRFGTNLSASSLFLPLPSSTIKYFSGYWYLGYGFLDKSSKVRESSQMCSGSPLLFLNASRKLSVGANLGSLNVEFLCVEYLQEQRVGRTNSFLNWLVREPFFFFCFFSPHPDMLASPSPFSSPVSDIRKPTWSGCQDKSAEELFISPYGPNVWHFQGRGIVTKTLEFPLLLSREVGWGLNEIQRTFSWGVIC